MNERGTIARLALFAAGLGVLAAVAAFAGRASEIDVAKAPDEAMAHGSQSSASTANGLSDAGSGYRLRLDAGILRAGAPARLDIALERSGEPFTRLDTAHGEPPLHLILVRRDLAGYVHVHPRLHGDRFTATVRLPTAGIWRAYADFEVDGEKIVLGRDVFVPGTFTPQPLPAPRVLATVDGYDVRLRRGADLTFEIARGGRPVPALQPYLGAGGHLVAIREDDLAYLHVHPRESSRPGTVTFEAELSEPGRYALFFQFKHDGSVHTAPFTLAK
ncbi:MAG: hypothetical protein QOF45_2777 [Gaiellaceae bacterium]|nr:hypothetical protein [Gaiellaceae bacterium]